MRAKWEEQGEDSNSLQEESHVSNRHMTGGTTPGGSELTTDHTCGRHETVEECGEQPREPRRKCAIRERTQGEKGRNGSKGKQREQKATPCTSSSTFPLQQPQQPQRQQQQCACNDARDVSQQCGLGLKHLRNQEYVAG